MIKVLYIILILVVLHNGSACWKSWKDETKVMCYFYRDRRHVYCKATTSSQLSGPCTAVKATGKGPAPLGEYMIGEGFIHKNVNWHNMYQKSRTGDFYYDYYRVNPDTGRSYIAFHVGTRSLGCVTVSKSCYFGKLKPEIDKATVSYTSVKAEETPSGKEYFKQVKTIGKMFVS